MDLYGLLFGEKFIKSKWEMVYAERIGLLFLLERLKPDISIEIGTHLGGSLGPISHYSRRAYSLDLKHDQELKDDYPNVEFLIGDSAHTLPGLVDRLNGDPEAILEFALIDGDHSADGVRRDIEGLLRYRPRKPLCLLMHDSFNPAVRTGILNADWESSPYVAAVELDFVQGVIQEKNETSLEMWGGLALALLWPEKRRKKLMITQLQSLAFRLMSGFSVHGQDHGLADDPGPRLGK